MLGMYNGFLKLSINAIAFISSVIAAYFLYPIVKELLIAYIFNVLMLGVVSGVLSYLISLVVFSIIGAKICDWMKPLSGGVVDRVSGLIGGIIRGGAISLFIFITIAVFTSSSYVGANNIEEIIKNIDTNTYPEWLQQSLTTKYFQMLILESPLPIHQEAKFS